MFDWIDRTTTRSFLQLEFCDTIGADLYLECARECGVDGGDVALPLAAGWLSLAMDSELGRAHCHQHVALSVFGVVIIANQSGSRKVTSWQGFISISVFAFSAA